MRYSEIVETAPKAARVWAAKKSTHDALRKYRGKQAKAADAFADAKALEPGEQRQRRVRSAQDKDRAARQGYGDALARANQKMADALRA